MGISANTLYNICAKTAFRMAFERITRIIVAVFTPFSLIRLLLLLLPSSSSFPTAHT